MHGNQFPISSFTNDRVGLRRKSAPISTHDFLSCNDVPNVPGGGLIAADLSGAPRSQLPEVYAIVKQRLRCICFRTTSRVTRNDVVFDGVDVLGTAAVMNQYRRVSRQYIVRVQVRNTEVVHV